MYRLIILLALILSACGGSGGSSGGTGPSVTSCKTRGQVLSAEPTLIAYGDSTMYGQQAMLRDSLEQLGKTVSFDNRGIGSTRLMQLLDGSCEYPVNLNDELSNDKSGMVVVENFGINEAFKLRSPVEFEQNLRAYVSIVRGKGMTPVIITPIHILNSTDVSPSLLATLADIARSVAAEMNVKLVDVYSIPSTTADFQPGLIHPTPKFYKTIADYTAEQIKDLL